MLFPTFSFIFLFLPITLLGAFLLGRSRTRTAVPWLAIASLVFYGAWDIRFVPLLLGSVAFNFLAGREIARRRAARGEDATLLAAAIAANLTLLGYFKYVNFFFSALAPHAGFEVARFDVILPLGISFFTFTQIAFLVDVHRGEAREYRFPEYLLFVTYFPHLIAGPLLHHRQVVPQFSRPGAFVPDALHFAIGVTIFVIGLAKKVLVADPLSQFASPVFDAVRDGASPRFFEAWMGALAYALQLYFDFSGYSDMAIGISLMFKIRLPANFHSPYKALSIIEFWRTWHMTLSAFLRDYVYIPLGGNRHGAFRRYTNLMATMLLAGLWHGAGWTFIAWGGLHGVYMLVNHSWRWVKRRLAWSNGTFLSRFGCRGLTFVAVVAAWVVFRADSLQSAGTILAAMAGAHGFSLPADLTDMLEHWAFTLPEGMVVFAGLAPVTRIDGRDALAGIAAGLAVVWLLPNVRQMFSSYRPTFDDLDGSRQAPGVGFVFHWKPRPAIGIAAGALFFLCLFHMATQRVSEFLYFQF